MSYNYFKNNAFLNSGGPANQTNYQSLDAIKSSGVSDLSAPSPQMLYDVDYEAVNTLFNTYTITTAQSTVTAGLKNAISGAKVWATPIYNAAFENLVGAQTTPHGNLQTTGQFERNVFDSPSANPIQPSNFPGLTKGCLWFAMSFWTPGSTQGAPNHLGTIYMNFPDLPATGSNGISSLFSPVYSKRVEAFVVYGSYLNQNESQYENGYTESYTQPDQTWTLSSESNANSDGYAQISSSAFRISANDGVWGFRTSGDVALTPFGGSVKSFGVQNYNSLDSSVDDIYWGTFTKSNNQSWRGNIWTVTT